MVKLNVFAINNIYIEKNYKEQLEHFFVLFSHLIVLHFGTFFMLQNYNKIIKILFKNLLIYRAITNLHKFTWANVDTVADRRQTGVAG